MDPNRNILQLFEKRRQPKDISIHMSQDGEWDGNNSFGVGYDNEQNREFNDFHGGVSLFNLHQSCIHFLFT